MSSTAGSDGDWKACVDWLARCGLIPVGHPVTSPSAQFPELAVLLRDGVLLCRLLNLLQPGSVDPSSFSQHPHTSLFLYKRNVRTFLDTCETKFGLSSKDLFDPFDLMEIGHFGSVILTLSKLSQSPGALELINQSFKLDEKSNSSVDYVNMRSIDFSDDENSDEQDAEMQRAEEDIYGRLLDYVKSPSQPVAKQGTESDLRIQELIATEQGYVNALRMMIDGFMKPLKTVLTLTDHGIIFRRFEELHEIHIDFLEALQTAYSNDSSRTISDCFIMFKDKFLVYADFCSNLPKAVKRVQQACKTSQYIKQSIMKCEKESSDSHFRLMDHLVVPMQRVLKYNLFLKEISKSHVGERSWKAAIAEYEDLSLFINEAKRDNEMLENLDLIEASISRLPKQDGRSLKDFGRLQMDGVLKLKAKKTQSVHVFLMDQLILICTTHKDRDEYANYLQVKSIKPNGKICYDKSIGCYTFVLRLQSSFEEIYVFGAKTNELAMKWVTAIRLAIDNVSPEFARSNGFDFVMCSFSSPTICDVCRKLLRGLFYQGYKCTVTEMAVHKECIERARDAEKPKILPPKDSIKAERSATVVSGNSKAQLVPSANQRQPFFSHLSSSNDVFSDNGTFPEHQQSCTSAPQPSWIPSRRMSGPESPQSAIAMSDVRAPDNCFAGNIDRAEAEGLLANKPLGTFLARISTRAGELIMSLNSTDRVRHVIINQTPEGQFFFKPNHKFNSLNDLVKYYQQNYLAELSTLLGTPQSHSVEMGLGTCTVLYNYAATAPHQLSLKQGDKIIVLSKTREQVGLWKGKLGSQVGYFPYTYVSED